MPLFFTFDLYREEDETMNPKDILDVAVVSVNSEGEGIARTGQDNFIVFKIGRAHV